MSIDLFSEYKWGEEFKISKVSYEDGTRTFKPGDDTGNNLWINQDNVFIVDEDQVKKIYNKVKDLTINSFEGSSVIDPAIDIGDKIIIEGKPIVYQGEMVLEGKFIAQFDSKIQIKQKEDTTIKKESQKSINRKVRSEINQIDGRITLEVSKIETKLEDEYSTTEEMKSAITQKAEEISAEVSKKVGEDELSTKIQQDYESVRIAWNKISEFIQFINAQLQIKDKNKNLLMALDKLGMHFYNNKGTELAEIGMQDTEVISFAVRNGQGSMAWGIKYTHDDTTDFYPVFSFNGKMESDGSSEAGGYGFDGHFDFEAPVRLFEHPIYFDNENGGYIQGDTLGGVIINVPGMQSGLGFGVDDGTGNTLLYLSKDIFQLMSDRIYITTLLGTELLEVGRNVGDGYSFDFKNNSIINAENIPFTDTIEYLSSGNNYLYVSNKDGTYFSLWTSSSDKNLKENIKDAEVRALDKIKRIKHKEFDWKLNQEHQDIGYIAQEMQEIDPTFARVAKFKTKQGEEKEDWQINTLSVLASVTKAIQEQQEIIESLQKQIKELKEGKK